MNNSEIQTEISKACAQAAIRRNETVQRADFLFEKKTEAIEKFRTQLPGLLTALAGVGLEIGHVFFSKTGMDSDIWKEGQDQLNVDLRLRPTSSKFKFLAFRGYTAGGASKNEKRRDEKAKSLRDTIKFNLPEAWAVQVNPNSFELRPGEETSKGILANIWIR